MTQKFCGTCKHHGEWYSGLHELVGLCQLPENLQYILLDTVCALWEEEKPVNEQPNNNRAATNDEQQ